MQNRILTQTEVKQITGFDPSEKNINYRRYGALKFYILSDIFEYLERILPLKKFEPLEVKNGFYIIESKMNC